MDEMITKAQYDSDMARHERNFKRLWILAIILIISLVGSNAGWMIYESQYADTVTETYRAAPVQKIEYYNDSEFSRRVAGRDPSEIMPVMDELMDTISIINPRLYNGVMDRLK